MEFKVNIELSASPALLEAIVNLTAVFQNQTGAQPEKAKPTRGKTAELAKPIIPTESIAAAEKPAAIIENGEIVEKVEETPAAEETPAIEETTITLEDLRSLVRDKAQAGHREAIKKLLTAADAENVTALAKEKYADFKAKVEVL